MRQSFTAVVERNTTFSADFETEPYETAWAGEARWFVRILDLYGENASLRVIPQLSPDGLHWCDDEKATALIINQPGLYTFALRDFGHWLRLRSELQGSQGSAKVLIYLVLKS